MEGAFGEALARARPDVVHVHHLTGASFGICRVAHQAGARVVFTLHDFWLGCARGQLVDLGGSRCIGPDEVRCARCLAPALWAPAPPAVAARLPLRTGPIRDRTRALVALAADVDRFLSPSPHLPSRIGLEAELFPYPLLRPTPPAPPPGEGPVRFLFLGSLIPTKGPAIVLEAFARLPAGAATLRLAGPVLPYGGTTRYGDALRRRVTEVPGVRWDGPADPADIARLLAESDVLLFPSTWEENSPFVLHEAAAAGVRVVASDIPGTTAVLRETGARVEPGDVDAWRRALASEVRRGRGRVAPLPMEDLQTHATRLLALYGDLRVPR